MRHVLAEKYSAILLIPPSDTPPVVFVLLLLPLDSHISRIKRCGGDSDNEGPSPPRGGGSRGDGRQGGKCHS